MIDADTAPPYERMKWMAETIVHFDGHTLTLAEHAQRWGRAVESVRERLAVGRSLRIALRDAKSEREWMLAEFRAFEKVEKAERRRGKPSRQKATPNRPLKPRIVHTIIHITKDRSK